MTTEAIERERELKETQNLYMNLRQVLARQPSPDIQQELIQTKKALKIRGDKMKVKKHKTHLPKRRCEGDILVFSV